jgi:predicted AAA+ superfamily ATPase
MAFKRTVESYLHQWKVSKSRKPLIIRGARQVGKTTLIRTFAKSYQNAILLNLERKGDLRYFEDFEDVEGQRLLFLFSSY